MLKDNELEHWFQLLKLPERGQKLIRTIRNSPPARVVHGGPKNRSGYYASRKMGVTIQSESGHYELAFIRIWEKDIEVLEYWDQPITIKINYIRKDGRNHGVLYTPDFFVIWKNRAGFVEVKPEKKMVELTEAQPGRYSRGDDGQWHSLPCEQYAAQFGLGYWIMTDAAIDRTYVRNIDFLEDYFSADPATIQDEDCVFIMGHLAAKPATRLSELIDLTLQAGLSTDIIFKLIAFERIYVDLSAAALKESDRVFVFLNEAAAKLYDPTVKLSHMSDASFIDVAIGRTILFGDRHAEIVNITGTEIWVCGQGQEKVLTLTHEQFDELFRSKKISGLELQVRPRYKEEAFEILSKAKPNELSEGIRRLEFVLSYLAGERFPEEVIATRTLLRYVADYRAAEASYDSGYLGLIPDFHSRGNRSQRFPDEVQKKVEDRLENDYETIKQKNFTVVHGALINDCEAEGLVAPSLPTFIKMARGRPKYEQTRKRKGNKAAKSIAPFSHWLEKDTPRQGDRPFQICHIDHTKLDQRFICSKTGKSLGRAWATFMSCGNTRRLPAVYCTYDPPSYRSCMMVLRECARRYGRLPQYLVVDGGKEFKSIYFRAFCAFFGIHLISREGKPRHGSTCERLFDTSRVQFTNNLLGNTQIMKNVREASKEVDPDKHAVWTIEAGYRRLTEWAYEIYDTQDHWTLKQSPREAYNAGIAQFGPREHLKIVYDELFRLLTLPTTRKGTAKVIVNCGVKINNIYYWAEEFRNPEIEGKQLPVRYDPFNMGGAYAYITGRWIPCISEYYWFFQGRTEREMHLASSEIRKRDRRLNQNRSIDAKRLASFVSSLEDEEKSLSAYRLLLQRNRDSELPGIISSVNGGQPAPLSHQQPPLSNTFQLPPADLAPLDNQVTVSENIIQPVDIPSSLTELELVGELD